MLAAVTGVRVDMYLSAILDPGVTSAWEEGELHTVIFSAAWMMHHRSSCVGWPLWNRKFQWKIEWTVSVAAVFNYYKPSGVFRMDKMLFLPACVGECLLVDSPSHNLVVMSVNHCHIVWCHWWPMLFSLSVAPSKSPLTPIIVRTVPTVKSMAFFLAFD